MLGAIELVANKALGLAFNGGTVGSFAMRACQNNGIIIRAVSGSSLAFFPPLIVTEAHIDEMIEKTAKSLD